VTTEKRVKAIRKLGWPARIFWREYQHHGESLILHMVQFQVRVGKNIYQCKEHISASTFGDCVAFKDLEDWVEYAGNECIDKTKSLILIQKNLNIEVDNVGRSSGVDGAQPDD